MSKIEVYLSRSGKKLSTEKRPAVLRELAAAPRARAAKKVRGKKAAKKAKAQATTPFTIEVRFLGGLTPTQKTAFKNAADRWTKVIVGDLPSVVVDGEVIDDLVILAEGQAIDGPGTILGQAGPTHLRPKAAGASGFLPAKGIMTFDSADLAQMQKEKTLLDVITHEMGHVLGIGTIWEHKKLLNGVGTDNPTFKGANAKKEYGKLKGGAPIAVPVENSGGLGTRDSHWRETIFKHELMSGFVGEAGNPISRVTVASLLDLGYKVDLSKAEKFTLPNLLKLAERGKLVAHAAPTDSGVMLPQIPTVLPSDSLE